MRTLLVIALAASALAQAADFPQPIAANETRSFPYALTGQLVFKNGDSWFSGSGVVIRSRSVLTAAHNLWNADNGFSAALFFRRGLAGDAVLSQQKPSRIYVLSGYRENAGKLQENDPRAFSYDLGALVFPDVVANGAAAGWWASPTLLTAPAVTLALGYGAEFHSGNELLSVAPKTPFTEVVGSFLENLSVYFESGMSGGPVWVRDADNRWFVTGVIVAGSNEPPSGGIRALDSATADFIRTSLK